MQTGKLFIVPTPIGNLEDITLRALRVLRECDLILAEDTRQTVKLLKHYDIQKEQLSYHSHNEHRILESVLKQLLSGKEIALVSDAGTPAISDPGFLLVRECHKNHIRVECLPGPTALIPALVKSGLPSDRFCFEGFIPEKKGRQTRLQKLSEEERCMVLYESPHRIGKTLQQLAEYLGPERPASLSRELSKIYEETLDGTLEELARQVATNPIKGEIVLVVAGKK